MRLVHVELGEPLIRARHTKQGSQAGDQTTRLRFGRPTALGLQGTPDQDNQLEKLWTGEEVRPFRNDRIRHSIDHHARNKSQLLALVLRCE
ncbi:hypothetical protein D3C85_1100480 [compost metagenome]